jgi:uroporphyrinogen-III synthase
MEKSDCTILSTRPLAEELLQQAAAKGFHIDCLSFIDTEPITDAGVAEKIRSVAARQATVVFTSMNAVDVVRQHIDQKPAWRIYAIGHTTMQLVEAHLGPVFGTAEYGGDLADTIIKNGESAVTFFCGDIRRDELPNKLQDAGIALEEVMVYHTIPLPQQLDKTYDGILFFSPSAVHSFFEKNVLPEQTTLFAIGQTTAAALNTYTQNRIYVADSPSKEGLVRDMMDYFSNQNGTQNDPIKE